MIWLKRKSYPKFWETYAAHFNSPQEKDVNNLRFVVFDTETTGLDIKKDRILSIGCIGIQNLKLNVSDQLETYLKQDLFDANTVKIHGLLKEGHIDKVTEETAIEEFLDYIKDAVVIAHHAAFDIAMINAGLKRLGLPKLKNTVLDTGHIFLMTKINTSKAHFSLDELAEQFNIPLHDRHTASGDAFITGLLFLKIVSHLKSKKSLSLNSLKSRPKYPGLL